MCKILRNEIEDSGGSLLTGTLTSGAREMRLRTTIATSALIVLAATFAGLSPVSAQDDASAARRSSASRGGKIVRPSSRSRKQAVERAAAYQDDVMAPSVPEMVEEGPAPPSVRPQSPRRCFT